MNFRRAFSLLAQKSGEHSFETAGNLLWWGAILTIVFGIGLILIFIAWIFATIGFFSIKTTTQPTQTMDTMLLLPPPPPTMTSQAHKILPKLRRTSSAKRHFLPKLRKTTDNLKPKTFLFYFLIKHYVNVKCETFHYVEKIKKKLTSICSC